ncbi:MAG: SDR family oxidoreductase [Thermodesulfovibrionales bacterium]|nr:SDR family oxidoreductase [Thermodesulfovibrionales bacterium]
MTNKVVVITGGTGGLGREIALAFYEAGCMVVVNYHKSEGEAERLAQVMCDKMLAAKADVSSLGDVSAMAEEVEKQWGRVDVLINNAGITKDSLLIKQSEKDWDRIIDVNLKGAFNCIKGFVPLMREGGHIINISSYSGLKGKGGQAAYSASKAALLGLTKTAAVELAEYKIKVNAFLPGYMPTEMGMNAEEAMKIAKEESLLHTLSDPKEAAGFILYLAGTKNITGQVFCLDSRIV